MRYSQEEDDRWLCSFFDRLDFVREETTYKIRQCLFFAPHGQNSLRADRSRCCKLEARYPQAILSTNVYKIHTLFVSFIVDEEVDEEMVGRVWKLCLEFGYAATRGAALVRGLLLQNLIPRLARPPSSLCQALISSLGSVAMWKARRAESRNFYSGGKGDSVKTCR